MDFGLFFNMHSFDGASHSNMVDFMLEQALYAEESGFSTIWMGEHHFGVEGFDVHPNPVLTSAYMAAKTSTVRLGLAAAIAPEWHPLRLAEDIAAVEHLSGGRVDAGVGRGITSRELANLNVLNPDRRADEERNWEIFTESIEIMKGAWTEDAFTYQGKHYRFPFPGVKDSSASWYPRDPRWRAEDGEYIAMHIVPKPVQTPHPPLWLVVDQPRGFGFAAEHGMKPITWLRSRAALRQALELYRQKMAEQGQELRLGEGTALMRTCFVAETDEEARRIAEPAFEWLHRDYLGGIRGRQIYAEPGEELSDEENDKPWFDFLSERGLLLAGSPETVRDGISELQSDLSLDQILIYSWIPKIERSDVWRSLELFATEVMPAFQTTGAAVTGQ
jgi:alkanesulfonate monooxygenase SsuD/methylene tetrahydromethanopterin reductase-like flavin-dependent oxidoreductase (luciferase family)